MVDVTHAGCWAQVDDPNVVEPHRCYFTRDHTGPHGCGCGHTWESTMTSEDPRPPSTVSVNNHFMVDHLFRYRRPTDEVAEVMASLRDAFIELGHRVVSDTPPGPDQTVAIRKLHEALMAAIANLALNTPEA